jgi:hypothetical protein
MIELRFLMQKVTGVGGARRAMDELKTNFRDVIMLLVILLLIGVS